MFYCWAVSVPLTAGVQCHVTPHKSRKIGLSGFPDCKCWLALELAPMTGQNKIWNRSGKIGFLLLTNISDLHSRLRNGLLLVSGLAIQSYLYSDRRTTFTCVKVYLVNPDGTFPSEQYLWNKSKIQRQLNNNVYTKHLYRKYIRFKKKKKKVNSNHYRPTPTSRTI